MSKNKFIILILVAYLLAACTPSQQAIHTAPASSPEEDAWTACTLFVEKQYGISYLDAERYDPNKVAIVSNGDYYVEAFFAKYSTTYRCLLKHSGDQWIADFVGPME